MWHACSQVCSCVLVFIRLRLNIFAAWQRDPFMCPLPGPTHQILSRNMPLPRARSDFSPYHRIKATLPFLMERGRGGNTGYFSSISQTIYSISSYWRSANGCSPCGSNLERMPGSARWSHWPKTHMRVKFRSGYNRCHLKSPSISFFFFWPHPSKDCTYHQNLNAGHPSRSNVTVALVNYCRVTHKSGLNLITVMRGSLQC